MNSVLGDFSLEMINKVRDLVSELLNDDDSGHGMEHVDRVYNLSLKFALQEDANPFVVALIALLHDVDDYKLFGLEHAEKLFNAKAIMDSVNISYDIQKQVLDAIKSMGFKKSLKGIRPTTIEGRVVSDADMCDALGINGLLRTFKYSLKYNQKFFDRNIFPTYDHDVKNISTSVCHIFEKILKLKDLMMTESGKKESSGRYQIIVDVLYQLFDEENALDWKIYLDNYLSAN